MTRYINWMEVSDQFNRGLPFRHVVIDNFFQPHIAEQLSNEFPDYNDPTLGFYNNAIENKKVFNKWDKFPKLTYQAFTMLSRFDFLFNMRGLVGNPNTAELWMDIGLNGGGWHMHTKGGKNNVHLDYNIHPKLGEQRKLNIIIYMTPNWMSGWGGNLQLWSHDDINNSPKKCEKAIDIKFNRAVIFDTTQNSWHGLPDELNLPNGIKRQSMAVYYLVDPKKDSSPRQRALYAPYKEQKEDPKILDLIQKRSTEICNTVYRV